MRLSRIDSDSSAGSSRVNWAVSIVQNDDDVQLDVQGSVGYTRGHGDLAFETFASEHIFTLAADTDIRVEIGEADQGSTLPIYRSEAGGTITIQRRTGGTS